MLLPLKPKPCQTAAISGKQDFAQRRSKRRRDHQRLLSKLRKHNTANCADNPNRPQSHPRQQARSAAAAARPQSPRRQQAQRAAAAGRAPQSPRRQARSAEAAAGTKARNSHAPPHQPSGPNQQRPHRRSLAAESPQAGAGLSFQNTPQTSVAPCPRLRRSRTRRHTWSRTF